MIDDLSASLQTYFGFTSFRPGQAEAILSLLDGHHILVVMPTGSGKSLIYQLAAMHLPGITLVISPLIALMKDQVDSLERRGISATFINSSLANNEQNQRLKGVAAGKYRLVYVAPERLRSDQFMNALQKQEVSLLAVDEAHCISEWGHDFRPDYLHIAHFRAALGSPLTAALTATATPQVQNDIVRLLGLTEEKRIVTGFNRPNLTFEVQTIVDLTARLKTLQKLLAGQTDGATIIYTGTRRDAEEVAEFVSTVIGVKTRHYHAGLPAVERTYIQNIFMAGDLPVVVATNAFGMGIDRPDVRQVIHYSLPGSIEAYYQEAGRAGRDGLHSRAVLLYSPEDRALQEFFIANSIVTIEDLRVIFDSTKHAIDWQNTITIDDISCLTGLPVIKVRVGLSVLERAGMLEHLGDQGLRMHIHLNDWKASEIKAITDKLKLHQEHRKKQLAAMIDYAESNACRRQILLKYFGDPGLAEAEDCCDNCRVHPAAPVSKNSDVSTLSQSERAALIVLDTVRRLKHNVGREKIAQILNGSKAKDILQFGYDKNTYYSRLAVFRQTEIEEMIDQLLELEYLKVIGGKYPVLRLTPKGETAVQSKAAIPLKMRREFTGQTIQRKKAERQAGGTLEYTAQLLAQGLSVEQIANQRSLTPNTIYSHCAKLIEAGRLSAVDIIPEDMIQIIEAAIRQVGSVQYLYPIKILLPDEIDYNVIRCVVESWKRKQAASSGGASGTVPSQPISPPVDLVDAFLSSPHPRQLPGLWNAGWALGFHSQFTGANWSRSGPGELAYRLKYQDDLSVLPSLVNLAVALIAEHPELAQVDAIVPVPPSTPRPHDPVSSFAKALAERLALAVLPVLTKARMTEPQKAMHTLAQKHANVSGAFALQSPVNGKRLLVIDDLYDSGATLEEIVRLLKGAGAVQVCVLTLTRTIHSDA
jgi:ATP-dependent DNA helicase RecQ